MHVANLIRLSAEAKVKRAERDKAKREAKKALQVAEAREKVEKVKQEREVLENLGVVPKMSLKNVGGTWPPKKMEGFVYIRKKKTKPNEGGWWDDKKKLEAVTTYQTVGTLELTSSIINVPVHTLRSWKRTDWWADYTNELQTDNNIQLDLKLEKVMNKSLEAVLDRIENGDVTYDPKTGRQFRIPPKLRDVQKVTTDLIEKRQLLRKVNTKQSTERQPQQVTADHLVQLAQAFAQFANGNKPLAPEVNIIDVETIKDALPEER